MLPRVLLACLAAALWLLPAGAADAASLPAGSTALLSGDASLLGSLPAPVSVSTSNRFAASQDGRYVAFSSRSDGLFPSDDDYVSNVYVRDTTTGSVTLVSRATGAGGEPAHDDCYQAAISDDGTRVAFACDGPLDPADSSSLSDIYVRDLVTGATTLVSRAGNLGAVGNQGSSQPSLSANGEYVAFSSFANNLHPDANSNEMRVYRRQLGGANPTIVVSRRSAAQGGAVVRGSQPSISDDGNVVAFTHDGGIQVVDSDDTNGPTSDVYVRDIAGATTTLASRKDGFGGTVGNGDSHSPALAGDGSAVAFESESNNFDLTYDTDAQPDVYRRSLSAGTTKLVNVTIDSAKGNFSTNPSIDDGGMVVAFVSRATNLHPDDTDARADAYVVNLTTNAIQVVSRGDGAPGAVANGVAENVALSGDGLRAVSRLQRGSVFPDADPRESVLLWRDIPAERSLSVARPPGGAPFVNSGGLSVFGSLSADGRYVAFISEAPELGLPPDVDRGVFVRDRVTGAVTYASRADGPGGAPIEPELDAPAISADGRRVAFITESEGPVNELWVRDIAQGRTFLASRADGAGGTPANGESRTPDLDADGSRVAFFTYATNLGDGDTDQLPDVHVRDLETGRTLLASRANGAAGAKGTNESGLPSINADGTRVAFASRATNLGDGDTDDVLDIHLRDLSAGTTTLVSAAPGGPKGDQPSSDPSIDASGTRVAFHSSSTNLLGDTQGHAKVFVRNFTAGSLVIASRSDGAAGAVANADASSARISPDGGSVAFTSIAGNLVPGVAGGVRRTYVRDVAAGRTELVSRAGGPAGAPAARNADGLDISVDGSCVSFMTDQALVGPPSEYAQVYLRVRRADCAAAPAGPGGGPTAPAADTTAPVISRARLTRKGFRVGRAATPRAARVRRGTVLRFRSSEAATLTLRFDRLRGRRGRGAGVLTRRIKAGPGRVALSGRIGKRRMKPGGYRLTLRARDAAGNSSRAVRLSLRILKG
jgi:Tol biopolymer transport system component